MNTGQIVRAQNTLNSTERVSCPELIKERTKVLRMIEVIFRASGNCITAKGKGNNLLTGLRSG